MYFLVIKFCFTKRHVNQRYAINTSWFSYILVIKFGWGNKYFRNQALWSYNLLIQLLVVEKVRFLYSYLGGENVYKVPQLNNFGLWVRVLEKMYRKCPDWTIWEYEYMYFKKCIQSARLDNFGVQLCVLEKMYRKRSNWTILEYEYETFVLFYDWRKVKKLKFIWLCLYLIFCYLFVLKKLWFFALLK